MHSLEGKIGAGESLLERLEQQLLRPSATDTNLLAPEGDAGHC